MPWFWLLHVAMQALGVALPVCWKGRMAAVEPDAERRDQRQVGRGQESRPAARSSAPESKEVEPRTQSGEAMTDDCVES